MILVVVVVVGLLDAGPKASDVAALLQLLVKRQVATDDNTAASRNVALARDESSKWHSEPRSHCRLL